MANLSSSVACTYPEASPMLSGTGQGVSRAGNRSLYPILIIYVASDCFPQCGV